MVNDPIVVHIRVESKYHNLAWSKLTLIVIFRQENIIHSAFE